MKQILFILLVLSLSLVNAHASELSLEECIALALENNRGLKAFEMDVLASEADMKISRTRFLPLLKLNSNYTLLDKPDVIIINSDSFAAGIPPEDVELSAKNRNMYGLSLGIEQPLFTGGNLTHSFMKSKILNEEARYNVERQKKLLIFEIKKAFHEALKEQLYKGILEKIIESKKERLRVLEELFSEGYAQREDVLLIETDLSSSELDLYKAKNRVDFALSNLKRLIYYQGADELSLKGKPINGFLTASLQELKESALQNREDLKMSLFKIKIAEEDIKIAKSGFYPQASLEGKYTMQKETNIVRPEVWMLTAQIDWPIFEWGKTRSEVSKTEVQKRRLKYEHEELERTIVLEAEQSWRVFKENEKEVEVKEKRLRTAEYRFKQAMDRYTERVIKLVDLFEMEAGLVKACNEYIIAINDLDVSLAHLEVSTSSSTEKWFTISDIYKPDLESFSKKLKELIAKKRAEPEDKSIDSEHRDSIDDPNSLSMTLEDKYVETEPIDNTHSSSVVVQVASYKTRRPAERLRNNLLEKIGDKKIEICHHRKFYKVRIMGFRDREEAEDLAMDLGIKGYLIIRADHEL
jgi:outer membrane protein